MSHVPLLMRHRQDTTPSGVSGTQKKEPCQMWPGLSRSKWGRRGGAGWTDAQEAEGMGCSGEAPRGRPKALAWFPRTGGPPGDGLEEVTCLGEMPRSVWDLVVARGSGNTLEGVQGGLEGQRAKGTGR